MVAIVPLDQMRRIELQRLTEDNGFGLPQGEADGWARFTGLAIPQALHVARTADDRWLIGIAHAGVMENVIADNPADTAARPDGGIAVAVSELGLGPMIRRMARLARSLPAEQNRLIENVRSQIRRHILKGETPEAKDFQQRYLAGTGVKARWKDKEAVTE